MRIFLDSSVLIEFENGRNRELLTALVTNTNFILCINSVVASEYFYKLLAIIGGKSPMSICESKKIKDVLSQHNTERFLSFFTILDTPKEAVLLSLSFMKKYNLLPNDALILATCKIHNINVLASLDTDYTYACQQENIQLIYSNDIISLL